jgi:hypothetical protein
MWLKIGMLGNGIEYKQIDDELSAIGSSTICHRKTYKLAQDAFFNKMPREKDLLRLLLI